jgi:hypothetical protein
MDAGNTWSSCMGVSKVSKGTRIIPPPPPKRPFIIPQQKPAKIAPRCFFIAAPESFSVAFPKWYKI